MRPVSFDAPVSFFAPSAMVEEMRKKAAREGRSISEVMRAALRRELSEAA